MLAEDREDRALQACAVCGRANCTSQDYSGPEKVIPQGLHDSGHATAQGEGGGRRKHRDRPEATKHIGGPDHTK